MLFWLQLRTVQKCLLKNGIFWRESFVSHSKRGPGKSSLPLLPFTGIVKDLSPQTSPVAMIELHASVSPLLSFGLFFNLLFFEFCLILSFHPPLMQKWRKTKGKALFAKMPLNAPRSSRRGGAPYRGTAPIKPFLKRKPTDKGDCPAKKPKEVVTATAEEKSRSVQVPPPCHSVGKGLMTALGPTPEKHTLSFVRTLIACGALVVHY